MPYKSPEAPALEPDIQRPTPEQVRDAGTLICFALSGRADQEKALAAARLLRRVPAMLRDDMIRDVLAIERRHGRRYEPVWVRDGLIMDPRDTLPKTGREMPRPHLKRLAGGRRGDGRTAAISVRSFDVDG